MENQLPSYQQATGTQDWLGVVAPYVGVHDYRTLCLVSKRFNAVFTPCLYRSPLTMGGQLTVVGDPDRERVWYRKLMRTCLQARTSALPMIRVLDFRTMSPVDSTAVMTSPILDITADINGLSRSLPNLRCLVLDRRVDYNLRHLKTFLNSIQDSTQGPLKKITLLSLRYHPQLGLPDILHQQSLYSLVYLDVSYTSGWARDLQHAHWFVHANLPNLRALKLSHMALDSSTVGRILFSFHLQLWSLEVSGNKLDDGFIRSLRDHGMRCDVSSRLQHDGHFEVEGKLRRSDIADSVYFVDESDVSATFSHPLRYFADPPIYNEDSEEENRHRPIKPTRLLGTERVRGDSVDDAIAVLAGATHDPVPVTAEWPSRVPQPGGLTHLHMNELEVSLKSVQSMLGNNSGYLEHFECDQARFLLSSHRERGEWLSKAPWLSSATVLSGFFDSAYLFRPVISSNLRVLKIHHSLITNVPTVISKSASTLESIWVAEKLFHGPIELAYPQTYVPDMNPRLYSLTLAHIPRYSPGVIAKRIINFLKLLAAQEQAIEQTKRLVPHRGPPVLRGLRHICLEFDSDAQAEMANLNTDDDVDEALDEFSSFTFTDSAWNATVAPPEPPVSQPRRQSTGIRSTSSSNVSTNHAPSTTQKQQQPQQIPTADDGRLNVFPYTATTTEHLPFPISAELVVDVWIGNGILSAPANTPAARAYMRALTLSNGRYASDVTPATPGHVAAGVPAGSYIFGDAWRRLALPEEMVKRPTRAELAECMSDVLGEIKAFRLASRELYARLVEEGNVSGEMGQHEYWRGRVEIALVEPKKEFDVMYGQ
ncbi:hypothetical protein N0V82_009325 [Gnomoniopsis sp. IMI 355080]|nr:hypothetical protein N0V82_009325 [Gnomoniopsis sp. IMI 355080]